MLTATASDGTNALAHDEGQGPAILLLHPGLDDGRRCKRIARILAGRAIGCCGYTGGSTGWMVA